jgi:hypothetical protein
MSNASMATMIAVAKSIFNPATEGIVEVFNGIGAFLKERIEDLGSPVPIWAQGNGDWLALGPDDVDGYYQVEHDLDTVIPVERMQKAQFMADAYARGFFSKRQTIEDGYGQHDPEKAIVERQLEDLENSAGLQQYVMTQVLRKLGAMQPPPNPGTPANIPMGMGGPGAVVMPGGSQSPLLPGGATVPPPQPTQEGVPPMGTQAGLPGSM